MVGLMLLFKKTKQITVTICYNHNLLTNSHCSITVYQYLMLSCLSESVNDCCKINIFHGENKLHSVSW